MAEHRFIAMSVLQNIRNVLAQDPASARWRRALEEEERGLRIISEYGTQSPHYSTNGAGEHSFSAKVLGA